MKFYISADRPQAFKKNYVLIKYVILDSERSEEASGFTMVFIFFISSIQNFYQKECFDFNI